MSTSRALVAVWLLALLCPQPLHARWESSKDTKSVTDLEQMTNDQLFDEAFDVCVYHALMKDTASSDYLHSISDAARAKNDGTVPPWMTELLNAQKGKGRLTLVTPQQHCP